MITSQFNEYYQKLNKAQKEAVDTIEGPVMVIAGPGTGKTQILTVRIANILLQSQVNPENILALTFTESGVAAMRKRLVSIIGTPGYRVEIGTFHSFCNAIIKANPEDFPYLLASEPITEVEQIQIIEQILNEGQFTLLKPLGEPLFYLRTILSAMNDLKKEGVSVDQFKQAVEAQKKNFAAIDDLYHEKGAHKGKMKKEYQDLQKNINKNDELTAIYEQYQQLLREKKYYDFNDMLMEVLAALEKNEDLLLRLQEQFQYILVDEHQDTNFAQNRLVELLCSYYDNPNLFVVGDEKQAIFRFQGASLENFLYFQKLYPSAKIINLEDNYRSTQIILDAASSVIVQNASSDILSKVSLKANVTYNEKEIRIASFTDYYAEYHYVASEIKHLINKGIPMQEIAILVRRNKDLTPMVEALEQLSIPYTIEADQNILLDPSVRKLILLFRSIIHFGDDREFIQLLHCDFLQVDPLDLYRLMNESNRSKISLFEVISNPTHLQKIHLTNSDRITQLYEKLKDWHRMAVNDSIDYCFVTIFKESGLLNWILHQKNSLESLEKISGLFTEVKNRTERNPLFNLQDFIAYIDLLETHEILVKKSTSGVAQKAVRLMTAHKSKGLEFEYVYILQAYDGHWGNQRKISKNLALPWEELGIKMNVEVKLEEIEDERRLFYVALTRAKKEILITYSSAGLDRKEQVPSQFLEEIALEHKESIDTTAFEEDFVIHRERLFAPRATFGVSLQDKNAWNEHQEFLRALFLERGLSVSALNNYLNCPWRYFYRNLLVLPEAKALPMIFGTAIHKSINHYVKSLKSSPFTLDEIYNHFIKALQDELPEGNNMEQLKLKGKNALTNFYQSEMKEWNNDVLTETYIKGVNLEDNVVLNGMIDMIVPNGKNGEVVVYDFKTGKPKSRGEIEGTTASSNGDYKRQLVFYKILLDHYHQGKMKMNEGIISFVEPDDRGTYRKELFSISGDEVEALEHQIQFVAQEIVTLAFWDRRCEDKACEYCALRDLMESPQKTDEIIAPVVVKQKKKIGHIVKDQVGLFDDISLQKEEIEA